MRPILILISLFILPNIIYSQNTIRPSKQWEGEKIAYPYPYFNTKLRTDYKEIDNKFYLELTRKTNEGWFGGTGQYYREEDQKVYKLYNGVERVILDFSLNVGDSIQVSNDLGETFTFIPYRTADTTIQNIVRRKLELKGFPNEMPNSNQVKHVWIEGVGDTGFFFGDGEVYYNIRASLTYCVRDFVYIYGAGKFCPNFIPTSTNENEFTLNYKYDPHAKIIYFEDELISQVQIYTTTGSKFRNYDLNSNNQSVDLSDIDLSMCVVVAFDGRTYQSKILKL